jgi:8-oxo-dGTP diphosphatase
MGETIKVCCAILVDNDKILCAKRSATMSLPHKWEFPGGKIEPGEKPEHALKRELSEELGIEIEVLQEFRSNFHRYSEGKQIELIPFLARIVDGNPDPVEHQAVIWLGVNELVGLDWADADVPIVDEFIKWYRHRRVDSFCPSKN